LRKAIDTAVTSVPPCGLIEKWLIRFLEHRIGDKRIIRLVQKWLKAGVLEDGLVSVSERGTGQGAQHSVRGGQGAA
jgi:hypothetical protein